MVTGIIGIFLLILKQNKIYWVFSLILFICGVLGLYFYREISVFFLFIDKKSFVDTVFGRTKMVAYGTILYTTVLFIFSAGLLFLQHKSKIRKRPALKVQGHKVKSKLPSGKEGKKKKKSRS
ncbi:MAG: hypothetical protein GTN82_02775 [Candidatus Aminicenantes bacterium]|nr:hypothetical protein [Candidatus Aminicenantes bacterium]